MPPGEAAGLRSHYAPLAEKLANMAPEELLRR
jgi:hypothetical protein